MADLFWFAPAAKAPGVTYGMATDQQCTVFTGEFMVGSTGRIWPLERLLLCKLLSLLSQSVVLCRFACCVEQVPEVLSQTSQRSFGVLTVCATVCCCWGVDAYTHVTVQCMSYGEVKLAYLS